MLLVLVTHFDLIGLKILRIERYAKFLGLANKRLAEELMTWPTQPPDVRILTRSDVESIEPGSVLLTTIVLRRAVFICAVNRNRWEWHGVDWLAFR